MGKNKRTVTLSIDGDVYDKYKKYCEENGWILSKQIENFMVKEITNHKNSPKRGE